MNRWFSFPIRALCVLLSVAVLSCDNFSPEDPSDDEDTDVDVSVTGVSLDRNELKVYVGDTFTLYATVLPEDAADKSVEWFIDDPLVATVENGFITALAQGTAIITVSTCDGGFTAACEVEVMPVSVENIFLEESWVILAIDGTYRISANIYPDNATNTAIEWTSSDPSVVTVEEGIIRGVSEGDATITATTVDGGHTAECSVGVTPYVMSMTLEEYTYAVSLSMSGESSISIDWGDGTVELASINYSEQIFSHEYKDSDKAVHTITVAGYDGVAHLDCSDNSLTGLDVGRNTKLETLYCRSNLLTSLNVSANNSLKKLDCSYNRLAGLDVSENTALEELNAKSNLLSELELGDAECLIDLDCSYNGLTELHVSYSTIDRPGGYNGMYNLDCSNNRLERLTLEEGSIAGLNCSNNKLTQLDLNGVGVSGYVRLYRNLFNAEELNLIFGSVNEVIPWQGINILYIGGNPGTELCDTAIATDKGWKVNTLAE